MDGQYAGFADPHRIERVSQPRENRVVGLDSCGMERIPVSKLPLCFILVDAEFCARSKKQNSVTSATLFSLNLINLSYAPLPAAGRFFTPENFRLLQPLLFR